MFETNREHYVSLEQVADHNDASEKEYDANDPGEGSFQIFESRTSLILKWVTLTQKVDLTVSSALVTKGTKFTVFCFSLSGEKLLE